MMFLLYIVSFHILFFLFVLYSYVTFQQGQFFGHISTSFILIVRLELDTYCVAMQGASHLAMIVDENSTSYGDEIPLICNSWR